MAGMGVHRPVLNRQEKRCTQYSPPWFTGRWRDWHRGHGCEKDDGKPRTPEGALEIEQGEQQPHSGAARQLVEVERDLRESLRDGYLFGNFDEPLDAAGLRIVRVIQQRLTSGDRRQCLRPHDSRPPAHGGNRGVASPEERTGRED
jgi:hypothetical protein